MEKRDIKETKEMLKLLLTLAEAIAGSLEDGKVGFSDMLRFFGALRAVGPAVKDIGNMAAEIADLSKEEMAELEQYVVAEFDIANDILEGYIEKGLQATLLVLELVKPLLEKK